MNELKLVHPSDVEDYERGFSPSINVNAVPNTHSQYWIVSLDSWTTDKLSYLSKYVPISEIRTFYNWNTTTERMVEANIKKILIPTIESQVEQNPFHCYLFCYSVKKGEYVEGDLTSTGKQNIRIPIELSQQLSHIPNKFILYVRDSTTTLERLLGVETNE